MLLTLRYKVKAGLSIVSPGAGRSASEASPPDARYNQLMVRQVDAIFTQGSFRPIEPLALPEGTRVRLSVEEDKTPGRVPLAARIRTPRLAHPEDAADFVMEVREAGHAGVGRATVRFLRGPRCGFRNHLIFYRQPPDGSKSSASSTARETSNSRSGGQREAARPVSHDPSGRIGCWTVFHSHP